MSGVVKGIGKIFKKVAKVAKKVLPVALGVGALVFTAGAAMGVPSMQGGWGAAMSSLTKSMGATGALQNVLTGALTQAGYGAVLGAGTAAVMGKDALTGAGYGALGGAATGGVMGAMNLGTDPLSNIGTDKPLGKGFGAKSVALTGGGPVASPQVGPLGGTATDTLAGGTDPALAGQPMRISEAEAIAAASGGASAAPAGPAYSRGLLGQREWYDNPMVGGAVMGLGSGLVNAAAGADDTEAAERKALIWAEAKADERAWVSANYGNAGPGLLTRGNNTYIGNQGARPTPGQRFDPSTYGGQYVYDPASGQVVFVPTPTQVT